MTRAEPIPPAWLTPLAADEWRRVMRILAGREASVDALVVERHAAAYATWREAEAELEATGRVIVLRDDKGNVRGASPSPWVAIRDRALAEMTATATRLRL